MATLVKIGSVQARFLQLVVTEFVGSFVALKMKVYGHPLCKLYEILNTYIHCNKNMLSENMVVAIYRAVSLGHYHSRYGPAETTLYTRYYAYYIIIGIL